MNARTSIGWLVGMALTMASAVTGCAQDGVNPAAPTGASAPGKTPAPASNPGVAAQPPPRAAGAPGTLVDQSSPRTVSLSALSREIQKLVEAGVDERVITSYVTNCAGLFNLTADQIICLKNAGVSSQLLSVMLQHDRQMPPIAGPEALPAAAPAGPIATFLTPPESPIMAADESWAQEPRVGDDSYYAPEQPESIGPVRAPYAVKLNDPIIMLRLPTLTVPCW
jgi:hypothetical protein